MNITELGQVNLDNNDQAAFGATDECVTPGAFSEGQTHDVWGRYNALGLEIGRITGSNLFRTAVGRSARAFRPEAYLGLQRAQLELCLAELDRITAIGGAVLAYEAELHLWLEANPLTSEE